MQHKDGWYEILLQICIDHAFELLFFIKSGLGLSLVEWVLPLRVFGNNWSNTFAKVYHITLYCLK